MGQHLPDRDEAAVSPSLRSTTCARSSASPIIARVLNPQFTRVRYRKTVTWYYREIRNVTRAEILLSLWLCGWLGCLLAYFVSAVFKARVTATCWRAHVCWSVIPLFAFTWPVVIAVYFWLKARPALGRPSPSFGRFHRDRAKQGTQGSKNN